MLFVTNFKTLLLSVPSIPAVSPAVCDWIFVIIEPSRVFTLELFVAPDVPKLASPLAVTSPVKVAFPELSTVNFSVPLFLNL